MLVQETESMGRQTGAPSGLAIFAAKDLAPAIKTRAQEDGAAFAIIEGTNGDDWQLCQVAVLDRDCSLPARQHHQRGPGENGHIPRQRAASPLMFVLDGLKDKPPPWFGLAKKKGEKRLGFLDFSATTDPRSPIPMRQRLVFITNQLPYPPQSGGVIKSGGSSGIWPKASMLPS
ncbi:MAG: hypothetical protein IPL86_13350 [Flavobacteriales bacterium]|nr:hypothetical protein [Flavobacteriales bacterium]